MYTAKSDTTGLSTSRPLSLNVINPGSEHPSLPRPQVPEANGTELDLGSFNGDATVTLAAWPFMATGQLLWVTLSWTGESATIVTAHPVTPAEVGTTLHYTIDRSFLVAIADGAAVTLRAAVAFDESSDETHSVWFPVLSLTLRAAGPAFYIDPSTMELQVGESGRRKATGGRIPYSYVSSRSSVATVGASTGDVTARKAGTTIITASDAASSSANYTVIVTETLPDFDVESFVGLNGTYTPPLDRPALTITRLLHVVGERAYSANIPEPSFTSVDVAPKRPCRRITFSWTGTPPAINLGFADGEHYQTFPGSSPYSVSDPKGRLVTKFLIYCNDATKSSYIDDIRLDY